MYGGGLRRGGEGRGEWGALGFLLAGRIGLGLRV